MASVALVKVGFRGRELCTYVRNRAAPYAHHISPSMYSNQEKTYLLDLCMYVQICKHLLRRILSCLRERERRAMTICPEANLGFCGAGQSRVPWQIIVYVWNRAARMYMCVHEYILSNICTYINVNANYAAECHRNAIN